MLNAKAISYRGRRSNKTIKSFVLTNIELSGWLQLLMLLVKVLYSRYLIKLIGCAISGASDHPLPIGRSTVLSRVFYAHRYPYSC